jgi:hypothetical protein
MQVSDVPAVYFVEPTPQNIERISQDLAKGLYESCYINFVSAVPRSMLADLAKASMKANTAHKVAGVFDRYVSFVSLSASLFSLNLPSAYETIHRSKLADEIIQQYIERIADGVISVLISLKTLPIIRCPQGQASEMVARRVDERIRELLRGSTAAELFTTSGATAAGATQRPLLCILDRDVDLVSMIGHTWTYQAMAHDVLGMRLNRMKDVPVDEGGGGPPKTKSYAIDDTDGFWVQHAGEPFPVVANAVHEATENFKKQKETMGSDGSGGDGGLAAGLAATINALPEMSEKKRIIDMHTNIATALLNEVRARELDTYFEMEDLFSSQSLGKSCSQLQALLGRQDGGTLVDKTRALMCLYLTKPSIASDPKLAGLVTALREAGGDTSGLDFLQHLGSIQSMMGPTMAAPAVSNAQANVFGAFGGWADRLSSTGQGLLSAGMSNIKNIVASKKELPVCRILDSLMDPQKEDDKTQNYLYLDPKGPPASDGQEQHRLKSPFRNAVTFLVGGGNYVEMQQLQEWAQEHQKQVIYGSTDLVSPAEFVDELCHLGQAQGANLR